MMRNTHSIPWYNGTGIQPRLTLETSLERTLGLLAQLGNPHHTLPQVMHIAGTNGKGSTLAFLRAILEASGLRVHAYTSPHLHRFHERIYLAGNYITPDYLEHIIERTKHAHDGSPISFFEGTTAAAMLAFSENPADVLLLETGMGGRFDPTNCIPHPACTILTTISPDHVKMLGPSLTDIAWHKAGILKPNVPCIVSHQPTEALEVIAQHDFAPQLHYGQHWAIKKHAEYFEFIDSNGATPFPLPNLLGDHQLINAGNAIAALTVLDFPIIGEHIAYGLTHARWPARLERLTREDTPPHIELWYDGGHNEAAAHALAIQLEHWKKQDNKPITLIFATTQGKDISAMLTPLAPYVQHVYATTAAQEVNAVSPRAICAATEKAGLLAETFDSLHEALTKAYSTTTPTRVVIFGSLFLYTEL